MILFLFLFLGSSGIIVFVRLSYQESAELYSQASDRFTVYTDSQTVAGEGNETAPEPSVTPPIQVDFDTLCRENPDVIGWIYCEGTLIHYPVVQGTDNDYYLHHAYDGTPSNSGAIFMHCENQADFSDSNTIIYGHHMKNKTMFAALGNWAEQDFYETHPVMWLLTPEQNYRILLFSGYTTSSDSDAYTIFSGPCEELNAYLENAAAKSDFQAQMELDEDGRYILFSTCAYVFDNARSILHGKLIPV